MVLFLLVGAAAFAGERAYTHHKKSKAAKIAKSQPQTITALIVGPRSAKAVEEDIYEDLPPYQKDAQAMALGQGHVDFGVEGEVQPPVYSTSQQTIPIPERSPLREKVTL